MRGSALPQPGEKLELTVTKWINPPLEGPSITLRGKRTTRDDVLESLQSFLEKHLGSPVRYDLQLTKTTPHGVNGERAELLAPERQSWKKLAEVETVLNREGLADCMGTSYLVTVHITALTERVHRLLQQFADQA